MAALLTDRFRVVLAENFRSRVQLGESASLLSAFTAGGGDPTEFPIDLWLFFARSDSWSGGIPDPLDNQEGNFNIYDQMLGLKKVESSSIRGVIRNQTWSSGTVYDIYRHDYGSSYTDGDGVSRLVLGKRSESKLYETNFYVVTSEFKVYKCLSNNNGADSIEEPTSTSSAPFTTASDGYLWKYMYSVSASDFEKFKTDDYIPIPLQSQLVPGNEINPSSNFGGSIYNVVVEAKGLGYTIDDLFTVEGDGSNAQIQVSSVGVSGEINAVKVINPGQSYTYGELVPVVGQNSGSGAQIQAIFSPKEGIANNVGLELGAYRLGLNAKLNSADFPFENDFSVVGLIYNPIISDDATSIAIGTYRMKLQGALPQDPINDSLISSATNGASGKLIEYKEIDGVPYIWFTQENILNEGLNSSNDKVSFIPGAQITVGGSISGTISSDSDAISQPQITRGSGEIIYIDNRDPISRAADQSEDFKIILEF